MNGPLAARGTQTQVSSATEAERARGGVRSVALILLSATLLGALPLIPILHATATTPPGWRFTGNWTISPDYMQYMVWARQTQTIGPIVDNRFTPEANPPHLLVLFYYFVGQLSRATGVSAEFVYAYLAVPLAAALAVLVFWTVRQFISKPRHVWWVTGILLVGGGLGAHLRVLEGISAIRESPVLHRLLIEPLWNQGIFENHRGDYIFITAFDTHFLAIWIVSLGAVVSLYGTLRRYSRTRLMGSAALFGFATLFHVYEGVTLFAVLAGITACCWRSHYRRVVTIACGSCAAAVVACVLAAALLYSRSGLPVSTWRGPTVLFATLLIAYPVGWVGLATAGWAFWQRMDFDRRFLAGWVLGCTAVTLSAPFYPYPDRGTITFQVPIYILAGMAYFARRDRVSGPILALIVGLAGVTPIWMVQHVWRYSGFTTDAAHKFQDADHERIRDTIGRLASSTDILLADEYELLWLARAYPGRHYCAHFFLTTRYNERRREVARFFSADPEAQSRFLQTNRIRFVYVSADQSPARFRAVPGLRLVLATQAGSLFEHGDPAGVSLNSHGRGAPHDEGPASALMRPSCLESSPQAPSVRQRVSGVLVFARALATRQVRGDLEILLWAGRSSPYAAKFVGKTSAGMTR